jgi:hypothetical protein
VEAEGAYAAAAKRARADDLISFGHGGPKGSGCSRCRFKGCTHCPDAEEAEPRDDKDAAAPAKAAAKSAPRHAKPLNAQLADLERQLNKVQAIEQCLRTENVKLRGENAALRQRVKELEDKRAS